MSSWGDVASARNQRDIGDYDSGGWGDVAASRNRDDISTYRGDVASSINDKENQDQLTAEQQDRLRRENEAMESWHGADGDRWGSEADQIDQQEQDIADARRQGDPRNPRARGGNPAWQGAGADYDPNAQLPRGSYRHTDRFHRGKTKAVRRWHKTPVYQNAEQLKGIKKAVPRAAKKAKKKRTWF